MAEDMERAKRIVSESYEAFNRGDFDAAAEHLHPEVEWNRVVEVESPIEGKEAARANMDPVAWSEQRVEINDMETIGDSLVVDTVFHATGSSSGIALDSETFHVWKIKEGKGAKFQAFLERDDAVRAAREQEGLD
jgi:ketosteroid isomerase-like protein